VTTQPDRSKRAGVSKGGTTVFLDLHKFPQPELAGFANRCVLTNRGDHVEFAFIEDYTDGEMFWIARLVMPADDALKRFWKSAENFYEQTSRLYPDEAMIRGRTGGEVPDAAPTALVTNVVGTTRVGATGALDFYYLTPRSLHIASTMKASERKGVLDVLPIATIQLATTTMIAFFRELRGIAESFPSGRK